MVCQCLAVGQSRRGPHRILGRMANEVEGNRRECGVRGGKKVFAKSESEQRENGTVTCRFGHMEDVEGFDKSLVQDRGHIGVV